MGDPDTRACFRCSKEFEKNFFAKRQWKSENPTCRSCANDAVKFEQQHTTKVCTQCNKDREKDQFPKKQWKRDHPICRLCFELTKVSDEDNRACHECKRVLPRSEYNFHQWGRGDEALCHNCRAVFDKRFMETINSDRDLKLVDQPDGITLCEHGNERCEVCMVDFTLPNMFARKRAELGRDLTDKENEEVSQTFFKGINMPSNKKICIMDGMACCPRSGRKMSCPCNEVTYCSRSSFNSAARFLHAPL
ncbi:hypothetical protein THAOC_08860 [Thalassiosira oceanica]|uniref:Uncharacterized protein n=1 Tax=Thalassiosira oceanica TaxID=159749 RepID=K0STX9_THAOC|nr:hypothetical protein THAOC_08860 [Thalassiosira oceanica]|eukprot:EJK69843.1 hypothetical protein THAOC_08860 [Thalassiosira oceanica]